jgi:hypothetical protein
MEWYGAVGWTLRGQRYTKSRKLLKINRKNKTFPPIYNKNI